MAVARLTHAKVVRPVDVSEEAPLLALERRVLVARAQAKLEPAPLQRVVRLQARDVPVTGRETEMNRAVKVAGLCLIGGLFAGSVWAGAIAAQQQPPPSVDVNAAGSATASNQFATILSIVTGFAAMLAAQLFQFIRESRNRKWDLADRATARAEMRQHAETQRVETIMSAIEMAKVSNVNRQHIADMIGQNTELTADAALKAERAYVAANDFNSKLEALHRELAGLRQQTDGSNEGRT